MNTNEMLAFDFNDQEMKPKTRWFAANGSVVTDDDGYSVFIGGSLIGQYAPGDDVARNLLLLCCAENGSIKKGNLATAFGISTELLRQLKVQRQQEGLEGVVNRRLTGAPRKMTEELRVRVEVMFDAGMTIVQAHAAVRRSRKKVSRSLVALAHRAWKLRTEAARSQATTDSCEEIREESQPTLRLVYSETEERADPDATDVTKEDAPSRELDVESAESSSAEEPDNTPEAKPEETESSRSLRHIAPVSARHVQHLGVWLLLAMLNSWDIYGRAQRALAVSCRIRSSTLRIALDALVAALAIGQRCVEGVRRLATPSAGSLLRASHCPSAPWVRSIFGRAAKEGGASRLHVDVASHFVAEAVERSREGRPVVFYVDNHMRHYTGKQTIRKGWRMQDRRARPGVTDYYVHDEAGRPVLRIDVPEHSHLTHWLPPLADILREALGPDERLLVAFDRGGTFAEHLAKLRNMDVDFVTYERKPYRSYPRADFDQAFVYDKEEILVHDTRTNLGKGRGRVRRVALLMEDDVQINLLAISKLSPEDLYGVARGRWCQENGFKYANERWGQNQLDGRATEPVSPETVIPNPARAQLDRAIRIVRTKEGRLRCDLARLDGDAPKRAKLEAELSKAIKDREDFEAARPSFPKHAPLSETPLAGKLERHPGEYKMFIDSIRIASSNAEAELAALLAPNLKRPAEAKKVLANLFAAPGDVAVNDKSISVTLRPAGTKNERKATAALLQCVNAMRLTLPGDGEARVLRFRSQD